ncbi:glutathione S-transferase omega-1-like [Thalassophryne amazonica]|uniref:glutathione S-transferase omega-1-like n=1 Tax=Thalassophryne amazonica TaxID=390379 RepID=UPI0014724EC5|nr:glutathione S-transferase omega-1-like [Thalassophryne amazonica]
MRFCPFAHRARLVLNTKGIKHETININLSKKPEWFFLKNPSGLVPTVETSDGDMVYDSAVVCEYLDEVYPDKKLLPSSPFEKAQQKMIMEYFSSKIQPYFYNYNFVENDCVLQFLNNLILCPFSCLSDTPELKKWMESMLEDPGVKACMHPVDTHKGFYKTFIEKIPTMTKEEEP